MTLEQLLNLPACDLEQLTDAQILKMAEDNGWLKITRPELATRAIKGGTIRNVATGRTIEKDAKIGRAQSVVDKFGLDLDLDDLLR
jgi:hypothetical protein